MLIYDKTDIFYMMRNYLRPATPHGNTLRRFYTLQYIHQAKTKFSIDVIKKRQACIYILFSQEL